MSLWKEYLIPESLQEALACLRTCKPPVEIIAGGSDLLLDIQQGRHGIPHTLIDITRIPEMTRLDIKGDRLYIGAGVPVGELADSELVSQHAQAVAEGCALIGGPQVRNSATLGGNVAHALPAADGMIGLVCLDAKAVVINESGQIEQSILDMFQGHGKSTLVTGRDILVGFTIPLSKTNQASAFRRIMRPQGVALPILNTGVWLERDGELISGCRIVVGPSGPTPRRAVGVEKLLIGQSYRRQLLEDAYALLIEQVQFRTSAFRATSDYRKKVSRNLLFETLQAAWLRTGGSLE